MYVSVRSNISCFQAKPPAENIYSHFVVFWAGALSSATKQCLGACSKSHEFYRKLRDACGMPCPRVASSVLFFQHSGTQAAHLPACSGLTRDCDTTPVRVRLYFTDTHAPPLEHVGKGRFKTVSITVGRVLPRLYVYPYRTEPGRLPGRARPRTC